MAATRSDIHLSKVLQYARNGWPDHVPDELHPYWGKREEIAIEGDCVMWGTRLIIPTKLRKCVIEELHTAHPGVVRMKVLACSHVWWPGLDQEIEDYAKSCTSCQFDKHSPPCIPGHGQQFHTNIASLGMANSSMAVYPCRLCRTSEW